MEDSDFKGLNMKIAVAGLGLIGGSLALGLKKLNPQEIIGIDKDGNILEKALQDGIIDRGSIEGGELLRDADLIIVALYPRDTVEFIKKNIHNFKKNAVITDTCGIKAGIIDEVISFLPEDIDFVGGHPMAGKETKGFNSASADLFRGANYIITPVERNKESSIKLIEKTARAIGCKNVVSISPVEHDRIISFTSQLPHVIAVSLMSSGILEDNIGLFTGGSFKDATRVAAINSILWSQLFTLNAENLIDEIEKFENSINEIKKAILSEDKRALEDIFNNASLNKRRMMV